MEKVATYEQDFLKWTQQQAEYLQKGHWAELDVKNLIEELEALGRSEQKELSSYFQVLVMHLLKCQYQPEKRTPSWNTTLSNCRDKIQDCLEDTPSLQRFLQDSEWIEKYYRRARRDAAKETQKSLQAFPTECPYTISQILDPEFLA
ncbi:DUF29 domain-containing protein [Pseudanabaena mucicola]|uniref:DUF29 domain-containing protein n=1 Tax=Pseudanabaena mucicola FACHB-723 TaxID=2692860 RepID=A0ABR8A0T3_9CYAN|nr:DUF29 domain-containing protein [Pseudanabaena mucicola]MBD2189851.1 DUF29 domain-containing protein [Pseudanabaena mucicola FACHB-723]